MKEQARGGGNSCILKTMGALLATHGYPEEMYCEAARSEFTKLDTPTDQQATYRMYAAQLAGTNKMTLDILRHVGLPAGLVLAIVQTFASGRLKLILYTDGSPRWVKFVHIEDTHIMPIVHV